MEGEKVLALALTFKKGFGPKSIFELFEKYGSLAEAVEKEGIELSKELDRARGEILRASQLGVKVVPFFSEEYPQELLNLSSPPVALFVKGELHSSPAVSVVGSRRCSEYGRKTAFRLGRFLAKSGVPVISGLALGIDTAAHEGALAGGGETVAVLGSGIGRIYPSSNRGLAEKVAKSGALISEFPVDYPPKRENFPKRNRIVAALGEVLVVVEAQERSGTFITVDYALELGKEVFVVPGNIDSPFSRGTNKLLKEGARPLTDFEELLSFVKPKRFSPALPPPELSGVYSLLKETSLTADEIAHRLGLNPGAVSGILTRLEVEGLVKKEGALWFAL